MSYQTTNNWYGCLLCMLYLIFHAMCSVLFSMLGLHIILLCPLDGYIPPSLVSELQHTPFRFCWPVPTQCAVQLGRSVYKPIIILEPLCPLSLAVDLEHTFDMYTVSMVTLTRLLFIWSDFLCSGAMLWLLLRMVFWIMRKQSGRTWVGRSLVISIDWQVTSLLVLNEATGCAHLVLLYCCYYRTHSVCILGAVLLSFMAMQEMK